MLTPLLTLATIIRTKNAGPFRVTADVIFRSGHVYEQVKRAQLISPETISKAYGIPRERILSCIYFDQGQAVKITFRREISSGGVGDRDVYGAQQHAPLLGLFLDVEPEPTARRQQQR